MSRIDFKKELKHLYQPSAKKFQVVDVPPMNFLMIDGHGDPNTAQAYQDAVEALYGVAYKLKFTSKKEVGRDYVVPPLEGLWWAGDVETFTSQRDKSAWDWTMMIMQPEWITPAMVEEAVKGVEKAKGLPALSKLRLETYHEGLVAQIDRQYARLRRRKRLRAGGQASRDLPERPAPGGAGETQNRSPPTDSAGESRGDT
jgi:hypothetical protein